ncbi:TIM barrel protein [Arthrobacter sp. H35-D1]|uniref:sugar phosphate isomerase/epimerase family protein n=1 Tax=Arthrobacter sp. H35-D1 TaxID=3046202 RepID=UPI0024BBB29D|nr:TIM barrel protein [Arthrobacter sp. H35-D1]MDJ0314464.1 TIM barrel protein [Arthrobacter sp. H35-D1]
MPLAFSTLGCPGASLAQVIGIAREAGATGLELRAAAGEFIYPGMDAAACSAVAGELADAGLEVLALASYVRVCAASDGTVAVSVADGAAPGAADGAADGAAVYVAGGAAPGAGYPADAQAGYPAEDPVLAELLAAFDLAAALSTGNTGQGAQVRVFPGAGLEPCGVGEEPSPALAAADLRAARRLNAAAGHARDLGVGILLETHDSHPRASDVARILAHVEADAPVKVIWDLMHPWRHDETPERTAALLTESLAYAQYKDGVRTPDTHDVVLTLPGEGQLPLLRMNALAAEIAAMQGIFDPWVSLEWERAWHPELPPVGQALASLKALLA